MPEKKRKNFYGRIFLLIKYVRFSTFAKNLCHIIFFMITVYFPFLLPKVVIQQKIGVTGLVFYLSVLELTSRLEHCTGNCLYIMTE